MEVCILSLYSKQTFTNFYYYNNICSYTTTIHCQKASLNAGQIWVDKSVKFPRVKTSDPATIHCQKAQGRENIMSSSVPNIDKNWVNKLVKFSCVKTRPQFNIKP